MLENEAMPNFKFKEKSSIIESNGKSIYIVEYLPDVKGIKRSGVILCKPIWGERIRTHRIFTNLARLLAGLGIFVATCDYFGDGNSGGDSIDLSMPEMIDDIVYLTNIFFRKNQLHKISLLGLLIGANVAALSTAKLTNVDKLILIQPNLDPIEQLSTALRSNLSSQMVVHKRVIKDRSTLISEIKADQPVNIDGFMLAKKLWESFEAISPFSNQRFQFGGETIVISLIKKNSKGTNYDTIANSFLNCHVNRIEQEFIWTDWKIYRPKPIKLFETICGILLETNSKSIY